MIVHLLCAAWDCGNTILVFLETARHLINSALSFTGLIIVDSAESRQENDFFIIIYLYIVRN